MSVFLVFAQMAPKIPAAHQKSIVVFVVTIMCTFVNTLVELLEFRLQLVHLQTSAGSKIRDKPPSDMRCCYGFCMERNGNNLV